ncbi:hypothetical protein [Rufibacter tibetensis]|uniref:Uncharacterized protein n=1 Tax=Rufibacter tibetensis TaxID=512763 RepID=A0A0P0CHQ3_9BACT|nr:hypothetical protein [Rufibacter tibetensis]ALI98825.1 hypothetical protein DC20_07360 [Rufibacter tibetensis]
MEFERTETRDRTTKKASKKRLNKWLRVGISGLAGAVAVTIVHESVRRFYPEAPRMDILGMRAIAKGLRFAGQTPPNDDKLHAWSLVGDIVSNSLYYSLTGSGKKALWQGTVLGAIAGVGGVILPGPMGLGVAPSARTKQTQALTIGYYLLGGVAAGAVAHYLRKKKR